MPFRPSKADYNEFFDNYVRRVPEGDLRDILSR